VVVEPAASFQRLGEQGLLFLGGIEPILKHLTHISILDLNSAGVKRGTAPRLPQIRNAAFIPILERQELSAAVLVTRTTGTIQGELARQGMH
jgi:hypothetical protein